MNLRAILEEFSVSDNFLSSYNKKPFYIEVFKNPTRKEMKEIEEDKFHITRGVMTHDGNVYVTNKQRSVIHEDIVILLSKKGIVSDKYLNDWWHNKDSLEEFLSIVKHKNKWKPAESYSYDYSTEEPIYKERLNALKI